MLGNPLFISALKSPISPPLTSRQHTQHVSELLWEDKD